jgi:class 3 adenylate cyclase/tetratricopeptide (TPR) repeat protein
VQPCGECSEANPDRARFCLACGRALTPPDEEARKVVTVLFADVVGSTAAGEHHDPEVYRRVLHTHFECLQTITERHGGTVEKFIGDAMMAVFGLPRVHEDDALRAVRAAVEMRATTAQLAAGQPRGGVALAWRFGVNTGEVLVGGDAGRTLATGDAVNLAARLEQAAAPGEILIGATTHTLVRDALDAEPVRDLALKGKASPVAAYRVHDVHHLADGRLRRYDLPFVGRDDERALLDWVLRRVARNPTPQLVTVLGDAGIGKTRLVATALEDRDLLVLRGRCRTYDEGVPWWPLAEALADAAGIRVGTDDPPIVHRKLAELPAVPPPPDLVAAVSAAVGLTATGLDRDPVTALRHYFADLAGEDGLVLVFDDLHNADDDLLELLETLTTRARELPLAVIAVARATLLERRGSWGSGVVNATTLQLEPLTETDLATLVGHRLPGAVPGDVAAELVDAAGGNPLFLEELTAKLLEDGTLHQDVDGTWRRRGDAGLTVPATIQALLAARVDALDRADRAVLARAAVIGLRVPLDALRSLTPEQERPELEVRLDALGARDLLRPSRETFDFRHQFVRDAVYQSLPRRIRADLHERHAGWLMTAPTGGPLVDLLAAHHLERALDERRALDPTDPRLVGLRAQVAEWLLAAGGRALHRGDQSAAARLLGRAADELAEDDPRRALALADRGQALGALGDLEAADAVLELACVTAERTGDAAVCAHARLTAVGVRSYLSLDGWVEHARAVADEAVQVFTRTDDTRGLARAWGLRAETHYVRAEFEASEAAVDQAAIYADRATDDTEQRRNTFRRLILLPGGRRPVGEALATCDAVLTRYPDDRTIEARVLQMRALLLAMHGDHDGARDSLAGATERFQELNQRYWLAFGDIVGGRIAQLADDPDAAEAAFRHAIAELTAMGDRAFAALVAAELAATVPTELPDLADLVARAEVDGADDDLEARVWSGLARARLVTAQGDHDTAVAAARDATEAAAQGDGPVLQADALLGLARCAAAAVRNGGPVAHHRTALTATQEAAARYATKDHRVGLARARRLLEELERLATWSQAASPHGGGTP